MIDGYSLHDLRIIKDQRGSVMQMLRNDDDHFDKFGEIYFSQVNPGVFKGWHLHKLMTLNYACVVGRVQVFLMQEKTNASTATGMQHQMERVWLGQSREEYKLLTIRPGIWNAFMSDGDGPAIIANCATLPYDPTEIIRKHPDDFPFPEINPGEYEIAG